MTKEILKAIVLNVILRALSVMPHWLALVLGFYAGLVLFMLWCISMFGLWATLQNGLLVLAALMALASIGAVGWHALQVCIWRRSAARRGIQL